MSFLENLAQDGPQRILINRFLDLNGDGTGSKKVTGNYSDGGLGLTSFKIAPPAGQVFRLARLIIHVSDIGPIQNGGFYGTDITLTNGINMSAKSKGLEERDMLDGQNVFTTLDWGRFCYDVSSTDFSSGINVFQTRWTFTETGQYGRLVGDDGDFLSLNFHDDLSGLVDHTFLVQGYIER